ncbi:hypothetical protein [Providencia sp. PROV147]|uniref:hypothetical protein n=1 Tax=Providencia sp. PROV147 TaxID=2949857 RepID=UPI00234A4FBA|nr:hypothetical protein [Providencia sp. PROV147]
MELKNINVIGCHATSKTYADSILRSGFRSGAGRKGTGVYFWHADKFKCPIAELLCDGWYEQQFIRKKFSKCPDQSEAIIWCDISYDEDNYLNFDTPEIRNGLSQLIDSYSEEIESYENEGKHYRALRLISDLHNVFIESLSEDEGRDISVIRASVPYPAGFIEKDPRIRYKSNPFSYIVKKMEHIKIRKDSI